MTFIIISLITIIGVILAILAIALDDPAMFFLVCISAFASVIIFFSFAGSSYQKRATPEEVCIDTGKQLSTEAKYVNGNCFIKNKTGWIIVK